MLDGSIFFVEFVDRAVNLPTLNFISRRSRELNGQVTATNRILPNRHVFSFFFPSSSYYYYFTNRSQCDLCFSRDFKEK